MWRFVRPAIVGAALALATAAGWAPASSSAQPRIDNTVTPQAVTGIGVGTRLQDQYTEAWIHFHPVIQNDHLVVTHADNLAAICDIAAADGTWWTLVYSHNRRVVGYTWRSSLTNGNPQSCNTVPTGTSGVSDNTWVHLYPQANWAHRVMVPGEDIADICTLGNIYDPSDNSVRRWDLLLDHDSGSLAGFTWTTALENPYPPVPPCT